MSEIKGQLLGIILTIAIFGVVLAAMGTAFANVSQTIATRAEEIASVETSV